MDARSVQRLLEKIQGMAESAEHVGKRSSEGMEREPRLSAEAKKQLAPLYREHALRTVLLYSQMGAVVCDTIRPEAEDNTARGLVDLFHGNFAAMMERASSQLEREFGSEARLR